MTLQYIIILIILASAIAYAGYRVWKAFHPSDNNSPTCAGCPLKDNCKHKKASNHTLVDTNCPGKMKN